MGKTIKKIHRKFTRRPFVCPRCGNEIRCNQFTCHYCKFRIIDEKRRGKEPS